MAPKGLMVQQVQRDMAAVVAAKEASCSGTTANGNKYYEHEYGAVIVLPETNLLAQALMQHSALLPERLGRANTITPHITLVQGCWSTSEALGQLKYMVQFLRAQIKGGTLGNTIRFKSFLVPASDAGPNIFLDVDDGDLGEELCNELTRLVCAGAKPSGAMMQAAQGVLEGQVPDEIVLDEFREGGAWRPGNVITDQTCANRPHVTALYGHWNVANMKAVNEVLNSLLRRHGLGILELSLTPDMIQLYAIDVKGNLVERVPVPE